MEERISVPEALLPQHIEATTSFAQIFPVSHRPAEIERAVKVAGFAIMMPVEKLDSAWALQTLASEVLQLQALIARTERAAARRARLVVCTGVAVVAALGVIGWLY